MWGVAILLAGLTKSIYLRRREGRGCPLTLVLCEEGECRCSNLKSIAWGILNASRSTYMCAKIFHSVKSIKLYKANLVN
jgi:hypothetical protein